MNHPSNYALKPDESASVQYPLLSTQQGIFLADHLNETEDLYAIAHCIELPNSIQLNIFKQAIQRGLTEAQTITAAYSNEPEQGYFKTSTNVQIDIEILGFSHLSTEKAKQRVWDWMATDRNQAKSLKTQGKRLYRQVIFITQDKLYWYQRYHHIMLDGYSFIQLTKRIVELYQKLSQNEDVDASSYIAIDEVIQERLDYEQSEQFLQDQLFWKDYCNNLATPVTLSIHHSAPKTTARFIKHQLRISTGILKNIQSLAKNHKVALPDLMMSLALLYLNQMTDKNTLVVGVPFMRRLGSKALRSPLPTVNVLPVEFKVNEQDSWISLAQHIKAQLNIIRPHQKYDAEQILRDLKAVDIHERIYGPILNYKVFDQDLTIENQPLYTHHISTGPIDDFEFSFILQNQELIIELRADAIRYQADELAMHGERISLLLQSILAQPEQPCLQVNITSANEQTLLLQNGTGPDIQHVEKYNNILDIFYEQVHQHPDRVALVSGNIDAPDQLTFSELALKINQLTHYLKLHGAGKNTVIAAAIPRSAESIVVMLSVLNSGASFLPLDLDYPIDRMQMMCEDAHPLFVLTTQDIATQLPSTLKKVYLDDTQTIADIAAQSTAEIPASERQFGFKDVAYVIFTSGSTGRPKGVMNTHGSLLNLILSHQHTIYWPVLQVVQQRFPHRPLRAAHTHSFSFDSSWLQVFWMIWGQELHIFDENMRRDAWGLVQEIQKRHIDTLDLPPSFCAQMMTNGLFEAGKHHPSLILIGGEAAPLALWQQLNAQPNLFAHNLYGPTEYTVDTFRAELKLTERPVIANPIGNTHAYVLDRHLKRCPIGVIGELYISGYGIANGYLGRADLSATRFVANPFQSGERMYRTGDLVRWNYDGKLEFMGRCDDQIKIRGYRVEIGEVENALSVLPDIESVVVIAEPINNSHRLLGYCVVKNLQWDEEKAEMLSEYYLSVLRQKIPEYMVPSALTVLDQFPRNVSGKVDKKVLPRPQIRTGSRQAQTPQQQLLCKISAEILKLDHMGIDDDFFMTGGDSISAIMLCTQLRQHGYLLKPSDVFQLKTIAAIATQLKQLETLSPAVSRQIVDDELQQHVRLNYGQHYYALPLLPLQKGMLFHTQAEQHANYHAFTQISLKGNVDFSLLQLALNRVLEKHPQLSGWFDHQTSEEPIFIYSTQPLQAWPLQYIPCEAQHLEAKIQELLNVPMHIDQENGLIQAALLQHQPDQYELLLLVHHLLTDGWSTPLFMQDLIEAYQDPETELPVLQYSYQSVIEQLAGRDQHADLEVWQRDLADAQALILFDGYEKQAVQEHSIQLSPETSKSLQQRLRQSGITLNVYMQMIWAMTLHMYAHHDDLIFGTPVSGRTVAISGLEQQIGLFLNTIPVRVQLNMHLSLWQQLAELQNLHSQHLEHDGVGLSAIQQHLGMGPLFDTLLVVENYPDHGYLQQQFGEARIQQLLNRGYSHYPLALLVIPDESIELLLEQRRVITAPEQFLARMVQMIEISLRSPEKMLSHYPLQDKTEQLLIQKINSTSHPVPRTTLQQLLRDAMQQHTHQIALIEEDTEYSFADVEQQVFALTQKLQSLGVQSGDLVAIALPRSARLSIAILAVIETGAAYLPIDLQHPISRIQYMLEDAQPRLLITASGLLEETSIKRYDFDEILALQHLQVSTAPAISPSHPAYMIYTSGTTGQPKGVLVSHQAIINRILWMQDHYPLTVKDRILQKTPCTFDVSVWEFFWSYLTGAQLVIAPVDAHKDPIMLLDLIQHHGITTLHFVPSMLSVFETAVSEVLSENQIQALPLKRVFCSGEALTTAVAKRFKTQFNCELHNLYGPTEAAVDVSSMEVTQEQITKYPHSIPIGYPVWNTELYILDQYLRPVPMGVDGELYIAGSQLAMGYLNRAELSATRFVANPFQAGQRMYRSGDIARFNSDGSIQYIGRTDDQLKIRGQRIELGEIEQQIRQFSGISNVVVQPVSLSGNASSDHETKNDATGNKTTQSNPNSDTDIQLVAYLQTHEQIDIAVLKKKLKQCLPEYMCPAEFIYLEKFPLSHNGKLDRKALPKPDRKDQTKSQRFASSELEHRVCEIFQKLLNINSPIAIDEDFFAIGGHSILVMRLAIDIKKAFHQTISIGELMVNASIERIAALLLSKERLAEVEKTGMQDILPIRSGSSTPLFCFYPGSGSAWQYTVLNRYLDPEIPIIGFQSTRPNGLLAKCKSMDELIEKQIALLFLQQPQGPFRLLGYSLGGTIAYAIAVRLQELGYEVDYLGLLDTYPAEIHQWQEESVEEKNAEAEQMQFFADLMADADSDFHQQALKIQEDIFANYNDAVRLLKPYKMQKFNGKMHLYVACKDLLPYIQPQAQWTPLVNELEITYLEHVDHTNILSPEKLVHLGPILNQHIKNEMLNVEQV
ncbi:amino acid adenylation domain-containing protein [Acinetobacter sp. 194]|uniref:non-ribosomal peptide synthetase n=1 Tax=Acinetobacter shaoyimingii TaxID=2715164 RepID=UPI00140BA69E|nr:non-ribosomal peptide synthetase [Acinetobacter shaoyimingii]NHB57257.1 amino acid adenylation domain-containing protein [Acinetobacter shaoyimingii]